MYKINLLLSFIALLYISIGLAEDHKVEQRSIHNLRLKHLHDHIMAHDEENNTEADSILAKWLSEIRGAKTDDSPVESDTPAQDDEEPIENEDAPAQSVPESTDNSMASSSVAETQPVIPSQPLFKSSGNLAATVPSVETPSSPVKEAQPIPASVNPPQAPPAAPAHPDAPQPAPSHTVPVIAAQAPANPPPAPPNHSAFVKPAQAPVNPPPSSAPNHNLAFNADHDSAAPNNDTDSANPNEETGAQEPHENPSDNVGSPSPPPEPTSPTIPDEMSPQAPPNVTTPSTNPTEPLDEPQATNAGTGTHQPTEGGPNQISNSTSSYTFTPTSSGSSSTVYSTSTYSNPDLTTVSPEPTSPIEDYNSTSSSDVSFNTKSFDSSSTLYGTGYSSSTISTNLTSTTVYHASPTGLTPLPNNSSSSDLDSITYTSPSITGTGYYPSFTTTSSYNPIQSNSTGSYFPSISSTYSLPYLGTTYVPSASRPVPSNSTLTSSPTTTPTVIVPTYTNTASTFMPSSIIAETLASTETNNEPGPTPTGIPNTLPKIIQNPNSGSTPAQPSDTTEVQVGFEYPLNYPFVVSHPLSTSQIFTYLPIGIAEGLGLRTEEVIVKNLLPMDTTADLQYITTVARIYIPSTMVDTLRMDLGIPVSKIYQNEDESVATLMGYINPAIPFLPGGVTNAGIVNSNSSPSPTGKSQDNGVFGNPGPQNEQSPRAKGTTAGIALAAFGGAAAYGAAMFLLARRYKQRNMQRMRSNSVSSLPESRFMSESTEGHGEVLAHPHDSESRGSARTRNSGVNNHTISGPVMAENSLGWN